MTRKQKNIIEIIERNKRTRRFTSEIRKDFKDRIEKVKREKEELYQGNKYSYLHNYTGINLIKGINYSTVFSHLLYKYFYFMENGTEKSKEYVFFNDDFFYQTDYDITVSTGLGRNSITTVLDELIKDGLIETKNIGIIKDGGYNQVRHIRVKYGKFVKLIKECDEEFKLILEYKSYQCKSHSSRHKIMSNHKDIVIKIDNENVDYVVNEMYLTRL